MGYEELLDEAYERVQFVESCERFEIPKVTGHYSGNKTIITNFSKIVSCLRREPRHLLKFLFKELASSGEISGDSLILFRRIPSQNVNAKIKKYTDLFVICPKCKKPDTELIKRGDKTFLRCLACGEQREIFD